VADLTADGGDHLPAVAVRTLRVLGPALTTIYNDAYAPMLGTKHPAALGAPLPTVWPEIWDQIGPMLTDVMGAGTATWSEDQLLVLERNGFAEACYFTYSFSPIHDEERGEVAGVFTAVCETTRRVIATRRLQTLTQLGDRMAAAHSVRGVAFAVLYVLTESGGARAIGTTGLPDEISPARWEAAALAAPHGERVLEIAEPQMAGTAVVLSVSGPRSSSPDAALVLGVSPRLTLDPDYRGFFRLIAHHVASALASAAGYETERARAGEMEEIALTLQCSLLPRRLPEVSGVELTGHYVPAGRALEVGGDFYDAIELGDDRVAVAIGDVAGHGVLAAAVMGQLRHALRAYALAGHMPAVLAASLDRLVLDAELTMTTCLCGVFDPATGTLEYANAGHPPPLIRRAGGSVERVREGLSVALGVAPNAQREQARMHLSVGDVLLLYTDGLVEHRGEAIDLGIDRLAVQLAQAPPVAAAICSEIVAAIESEPTDDIALLALGRATPAGRDGS
jgi:hypothetical protein